MAIVLRILVATLSSPSVSSVVLFNILVSLDLLLREPVSTKLDPFRSTLSIGEMGVDMRQSNSVRFWAMTFMHNDGFAEPTPEPALIVGRDATLSCRDFELMRICRHKLP